MTGRLMRRSIVTKVTPSMRKNNLMIAAGCASFVGGVWWYSMNKMKQEEMHVAPDINLHESGLKVTAMEFLSETPPDVPKATSETPKEEASTVSAPSSDIPAEIKSEVSSSAKKQRRWWLLWLA
eukprot:CAMPEP_0185767244 /NCGR_PEP_ID=MMETSP1174-20130828/41844_1 /TAXON_ID=35687 /ORGANISM="Dictyocha speculum, Strain CCMP1381" /LENGTH=123 /DNA_ID=CAMNT_0028451325 /DNA_START=35 /DNA_END=406 /DNA_ORIENTATION=-